MEETIITCKNCGNQFSGSYCNNCGQKASVHRITWGHMFHDLTHAMFHVDKGLLHSARELITRPGYTIVEYLEGKRVKHFNPLLMLILVGGFCSILYGMFNLRGLFGTIRVHDLEEQNSFVAHKYFAFTMFAACIIFTLGDRLILWKRNYTLPELFIGNAFICGQILLFEIAAIPIFLIGRYFNVNDYLRILFIIGLFAYLFITKYQFFAAANNKWLIIRILVLLSLYVLLAYLLVEKVVKPLFVL